MKLVFFGLTITSSWGNGHAATYRGLLRAMHRRGHRLEFFERDTEWYGSNRDLPQPDFTRVHLYRQWQDVRRAALAAALESDATIVGSYFSDAIPLLDDLADSGVRVVFYDIDTPVTLNLLRRGACSYLRADQIAGLDLYLSFTGGPLLTALERDWGARCAHPLYCSFDTAALSGADLPPLGLQAGFELSYLGTYAPDRQTKFRRLLLEPARRLAGRRFHVGGPMFPHVQDWPANVSYNFHLAPDHHAPFYRSARFTLNLTRQAMVEAGYSPSIRLFEAAAHGVAAITDRWAGVETFFTPGTEILLANETAEVIEYLTQLSPSDARRLGNAARERVLNCHTSDHRAAELESYLA